MWKSIKKFFQWIADHTGISWIARKISSCWKWLFGGSKSQAKPTQQNVQQQGESPDVEEQTLPKTVDNEVKPVGQIHSSDIIYEKDGKLIMALSMKTAQDVFAHDNLENMTEYCAKVGSGGYIAGRKIGLCHQSCLFLFSIDRVADQGTEFASIAKAKEILGLSDATKEVKVNYIREADYEFTSKVIANNNTPNSTTTSSEAEQLTASAGHSK